MPVPLIMQWLIGTWFIVNTDAPIWLKGDKTLPGTKYTLVEKKGEYKLLDETRYVKHKKHKKIVGYDYLAPHNDKGFKWRGKGLLFIATSKWDVKLEDPAGQWAVIAYSKTLFTPAGVDIISRKPHMDAAAIKDIQKKMMQDAELAKHVSKMKNIAQE